jgi:hypothetical protein
LRYASTILSQGVQMMEYFAAHAHVPGARQIIDPLAERMGATMSLIGPVAIMVLVLSPVLIPLMITAWHTLGGSNNRI